MRVKMDEQFLPQKVREHEKSAGEKFFSSLFRAPWKNCLALVETSPRTENDR
jgi:hypothetical protein